MTLSLQALAPAALLLAGGLLLLVRPNGTVFFLVQVATLAAVLRLSQLAATPVSLPVYQPLPDIPVVLRLDRLSLFFATTAVASALVVSLPGIGGGDRQLPLGWLTLAEFGAVGGILAGDLPGLSVGWGVAIAALFMLVLMPRLGALQRRPSAAVTRTLVVQLGAATLLLAGAVGVQATGGTATYEAIPVGAVDARMGLLLAAAPIAVLASLAALVRACRRPLTAALLLCGALLPLSAYALARVFDLSEGRPLPAAATVPLVLGAGLAAAVYALSSIWAPDLGSALARLLNALALLVAVAFAVAGAGGLTGLVVGYTSLVGITGACLLALDAGDGRLPGRGSLPRAVLAVLGLLPLAAVAGLGMALGLDGRLLLVRRLVEQGVGGVVLALPVLASLVAIVAGAVAAGRFGGGSLGRRRQVSGFAVAAVVVVGLQLLSPVVLDQAVGLAAAAARTPAADVRSAAAGALPGDVLRDVLLLAGLLLVGVVAFAPGAYSESDGLRHAPDLLPPRLAVAPGIVLGATLRGATRRGLAVGAGLRPHAPWLLAAGWVLAVVGVALGSR